jgi:hypothetical protein
VSGLLSRIQCAASSVTDMSSAQAAHGCFEGQSHRQSHLAMASIQPCNAWELMRCRVAPTQGGQSRLNSRAQRPVSSDQGISLAEDRGIQFPFSILPNGGIGFVPVECLFTRNSPIMRVPDLQSILAMVDTPSIRLIVSGSSPLLRTASKAQGALGPHSPILAHCSTM